MSLLAETSTRPGGPVIIRSKVRAILILASLQHLDLNIELLLCKLTKLGLPDFKIQKKKTSIKRLGILFKSANKTNFVTSETWTSLMLLRPCQETHDCLLDVIRENWAGILGLRLWYPRGHSRVIQGVIQGVFRVLQAFYRGSSGLFRGHFEVIFGLLFGVIKGSHRGYSGSFSGKDRLRLGVIVSNLKVCLKYLCTMSVPAKKNS